MIPDNDWYGHKFILSQYCGLRGERPIFGSVRHGWHLDWTPEVGRRRIQSAPVLVWNERHAAQARQLGCPNVVSIGAPFAYLTRMMCPDGIPPMGTGTIVFPAHSAEGKSHEYSARGLINEVQSRRPGPFTISIFYQDLARPEVDEYRRAGWRIVSFGNRSNRFFLVRQLLEIAAHEHAVSNLLHSALWYSAFLGRRCSIISDSTKGAAAAFYDVTDARLKERWPAFYQDHFEIDVFRSYGEQELGEDSLLSPQSLRETLGWRGLGKPVASRLIGQLIDLRHGQNVRKGDPKHSTSQ